MGMNRKGFYFTMDAFLASVILIGGMILISQHLGSDRPAEGMQYLSADLLTALSEIKVRELEPSVLSYLMTTNRTDLNLSIIEQVGTYWAAGETEYALNLTRHMMQGAIPANTGLSLSLGSLELYEKDIGQQTELYTADRMITGVVEGSPITGSTSSAYLRRIEDKRTSSFAYFGGLVGQGNLSVMIDDIPSDVTSSEISAMEMELDAGSQFSLFINGGLCGTFTPTNANMTPDYWNITTCKILITPGSNEFTVKFSQNITNAYVAGGYIKVLYTTSEQQAMNTTISEKTYKFPGVDGVVNLYDSFYIPGTLKNMSIYLHFDSSARTYLTVGDVLVYQENTNGTRALNFTDENLTSFPVNLNYGDLSNVTIPLRFAAYNETYTYVFGTNADVVLITDLSGSMKYRMNSWSNPGNAIPNCQPNDLTNPNSRRLGVAACLDDEVNAIIMNTSIGNNTNRLWLVDFSTNANPFFSSNLGLLTEENIENEIDDRYKSKSQNEIQGGTCICCAINQAYDILNAYSNSNRTKSVIVMSDGVPTACCGGHWSGAWQCDTNGTSTNAWWGSGSCTGDEADCSGNDCAGPMQSAINAAQRLHNNLNSTVYSVGFGPIDTCANANYTMAQIAQAGNGSYVVSANATILQNFYRNVSYQIMASLAQTSQLVSVQGVLSPSKLFNDSYISFTYDPVVSPPQPNEINVIVQTEQFGNCTPSVRIYDGIRVLEARIVSYSDYHWTNSLAIDGATVYNLTSFSSDYSRLGDPYQIQVPANLLTNGTHTFYIGTGDSPTNSTGCSPNNTLIYTALVPSSTSRSGVVEMTEGCTWTIQFEDDTYSIRSIPQEYTGTKQCSYTALNYTLAQGSYDSTDAYDIAVNNLLTTLDFDSNGKIFVNLESEDIEIVITTISSVPYLWGPSLVRASVWQ